MTHRGETYDKTHETYETYEKTFAGHEPLIVQHRAAGTGLLPASVQLEMAMVGIARRRPFVPLELTDVAFLRPLTLADDATAAVRLDVTHGAGTRFELSTVVAGDRKPLSTGTGRLLVDEVPPRAVGEPVGTRTIGSPELYRSWSYEGLEYGPDFRTVHGLAVADGVARARLRTEAEPLPWYAHPLLVDGVFQVVSCALQDLSRAAGPRPMLPIGIARLAVFADLSGLATGVTVLARRTGVDGAYSTADAQLLSPSGDVVAEFRGVRMRSTTGLGAKSGPRGTNAPVPAARAPQPVSRIHWRPAPGSAPPREPATGTWVVLHDATTGGPRERTVRQLRDEGARVIEVGIGAGSAHHPAPAPGDASAHGGDHDRFVLEQPDEHAFQQLWESVGDPVAGVVHLWNAGAPQEPVHAGAPHEARPESSDLRSGLYGCLAALKTLGARQRKSRFYVVTRDAQPVTDTDTPVPARAALWGLVRTAAIEYPGLRPRLVDLDDASDHALLAELGEGPREVGYRQGVRHEPFRRYERPAPAARRPVRAGGRYLVLGGHGGLGLEVAGRLADEGAAVVALVGRSGAAGADRERLTALASRGCSIVSYSADATVPGELAAVVERVRAEFGELHGVLHAAGTLRDGLIRSTTVQDVEAVLRPKVDGVRELAAATAGAELDFAVLFASVSGAFGNLGQGGYAAANAYLDAYAHACGAPWISVDWGLWGEVGMGTAVAEQLGRRGVRALGTQEALDALTAVLGGDARQVVIAHPDASHPEIEYDDVPDTGTGSTTPEPAGTHAAEAVEGVHADGAGERVEDELERFLAERLGVTDFDRATPLADYGMSSIMSVELSEELSRRWDLHLPATLFLEYGDFEELGQALVSRYGAATAVPEPAPPAPAPVPAVVPAPAPAPGSPPKPTRTPRGHDVAVVAVSGDLPGVRDVGDLWPLLRSGGDAFTEIPQDRWDIDAHFEQRGPHMTGTYCRTGAFVSEIDRFAPAFFGISVREAEEMDAQQKLLLEHAWAVRDDSGLAGVRDIGVFVGATYTHHRDAQGLEDVGPHTALGSLNAVLANRISYALDLTGPSQTVDTLCSSSLVAVQQAVAALRAGTCEAALVAACHVGLTPWYYRSLSQLGALSATRPRPFDDRADGFVPGEGAVAVMLKRLEDAERDGDRIWGVVRGTAVNHGGRGSALPVPRSAAQSAVVRAALADAGVVPADISLIETHGTATRLGDPIEIAALTEVFGADPARSGPCHLGSVKANIGHLEPASGLAGLVKVLLCLRHREIPPLAGFETPGAHIDLAPGPFVIPTEPLPWRSEGPRRAGISAFGMGGTNAHVVVEEYDAERSGRSTARPPVRGEHVLVLSGHTPDALAGREAAVHELLRDARPSLEALCFSAAVGRDHQRYRVAVLGSTAQEISTGLEYAMSRGGGHGNVVRGETFLAGGSATAHDAPLRCALRHVGGADVDWREVYDGTTTARIALPAYPFRAGSAGPVRATPTSVATSGAEPVAGPSGTGTAEALAGSVRQLSRAHRVFGEDTVPGALPVALALQRADVLGRVAFTGRGAGDHRLTSDLDDPARRGPVTFRHGDRVIARIEVEPESAAGRQAGAAVGDLAALRAELGRTLEPEGLYAWFAAKSMDIDEPLRSLAEVHYGPDRVLARIKDSSGSRIERAAVALDAALQSMAVLTLADPTAASTTYLPVSIGRVLKRGEPAGAAFVLFEGRGTGPDGARGGDASLLSADGLVLVRLEGIEYRTVATDPVRAPESAAARTPATGRRGQQVAAAEAEVLDLVRSVFHDPSIMPTTSLSSVGLDSLLATSVAARIEESYGVRLGPTDVLEAADCRTLAAYVAEQTQQTQQTARAEAAQQATPAEQAAPAEPPSPSASVRQSVGGATAKAPDSTVRATDMAVIGIAHALPGAPDTAGLWSLLSEGGTGIGPAPAHRWDERDAGQEPDVGGFLDNVEEFDARFFDFFPKQAQALDPQARWLLRTTWEALESAGLPPRQLPSSTGVFVGASYQHYKDYNLAPELDAASGLGNHNAFLANRVSYFLDLHGPSMTIDTLCSSSLVALHTAVRSIRDGECEQAVVAGVRVAMSPLHYTAMKNLRALSPSGSSRAFDVGADGFVPGEGVVSVVVKPLVAALRDGDRIRGVIRGSAVNHGGRTSGLTVPSSGAQQEVIARALVDAGVSPESIGLVEAHGTGTGLGDPIEVEGLTRAWRGFTERSQFCAIGSLKSNIGHLEPAAGLAGLVKVLLAMEHGVIPPTLHVRRPNDHIRFENTPFYLADRARPWPRGAQPRRAAVSAFGMGGVNAHVVLEEAPPAVVRAPFVAGSHVVRVTAADETALRNLATTYADRFDRAGDGWETADLCHTANVGRSPLEFQTAVHGRTAAELAAALRAVAADRVPIARADIDLHADNAAGQSAEEVVDLVRGGYAHVDWAALSVPGARLTDLPTYPFATEKYWHTHRTGGRTPARVDAEPALAEPEPAPARVDPHPVRVEPNPAQDVAAVQVVWHAGEPAPRSSTDRPTVRLVTPEPSMEYALTAALRERGTLLAGPGQRADAIVAVEGSAGKSAGTTGDADQLGAFWAELGALVKDLPTHGKLLWAGSGGVAVHASERAALRPGTAARAMAVRAACAESRKQCAVVHLDPADAVEAQARQIVAELAALPTAPDGADGAHDPESGAVAAYRRGIRYVPGTASVPPGPPHGLSTDGYYLVTGGLGAVGQRLVRQLIDRGAKRIGIVGRSRIDTEEFAPLRELARRADVEYLRCDVSDARALTAVAQEWGGRWGQLLGVVHCSGGVNPFGAMHRRPWSDAAHVVAPKVAGSLHAVRLAKQQGAGFVVLVSSIAGAQARAGRGLVDYALANAYQLALAESENDAATTVTAHAWPNWAGIGMEADASFSAAHSLDADLAANAFLGHLRSGGAVIFPGSPSAPRTAVAANAVPPLVTGNGARDGEYHGGGAGEGKGNGSYLSPAEFRAYVKDAFVHVLGADPGERRLQDLGLDSLVIAELATALEQRAGLVVDPSLLVRAATAADIAAGLAATAPPTQPSGPEDPDGPARHSVPDGQGASALSALLRPLLTHDRGR
ncbi:SDR family NAD(P)-dependent oxidoreductase [Streptomyces sp. NBC_00237]|uniref:SDR family NAD(P)-dependent oxidoreductase n=1 Tax=Streptomyces sp. NBC_00237 TaxID=2975687 RepID=UPI002254CFC5|nr:SDR family NAD(P)-dependent oxidoreductase [Streptomyces sp. NBC_00237]MCX5205625.1 SDR family NAD(P)-dependent oxidoreductase [Streptomyces sp. NBC_00237]